MPTKSTDEITKKILIEIGETFANQSIDFYEVFDAVTNKEYWRTFYQEAVAAIIDGHESRLIKLFRDGGQEHTVGLYAIRKLLDDPKTTAAKSLKIFYSFHLIQDLARKATITQLGQLHTAKSREVRLRNVFSGPGAKGRKTRAEVLEKLNSLGLTYRETRNAAAVQIAEQMSRNPKAVDKILRELKIKFPYKKRP